MSTIRVASIANIAGTGPSTLTGQEASKSNINFDGTGVINLLRGFNVSTLLDNGTGNYAWTYTNIFIDTNYACVFGGSAPQVNFRIPFVNTSSQTSIFVTNSGGSLTDFDFVCSNTIGDLA